MVRAERPNLTAPHDTLSADDQTAHFTKDTGIVFDMLTSTIPIVLALILGIVSFSASCFVIIRTLMPIIPAHPLSRRLPRTAFGLPKRKLSPAKKATLYIAFCDVLALATFLWQAIAESLGTSVNPATDAGSSTRLWLALTARQSCLLVVAALTLLYVRLGKTLTFGKFSVPLKLSLNDWC